MLTEILPKLTKLIIYPFSLKKVLENLVSHKNLSETESYKILKKHAEHTRTYTGTI